MGYTNLKKPNEKFEWACKVQVSVIEVSDWHVHPLTVISELNKY